MLRNAVIGMICLSLNVLATEPEPKPVSSPSPIPVINPTNVLPGPWFIPTGPRQNDGEIENDRQRN
jgi:hypothetical protein